MKDIFDLLPLDSHLNLGKGYPFTQKELQDSD